MPTKYENIQELYDDVSREADTDTLKIDVATCKRVCAVMRDKLQSQTVGDVLNLLGISQR